MVALSPPNRPESSRIRRGVGPCRIALIDGVRTENLEDLAQKMADFASIILTTHSQVWAHRLLLVGLRLETNELLDFRDRERSGAPVQPVHVARSSDSA